MRPVGLTQPRPLVMPAGLGEGASQGPVGTRGRVGWMRGPGACPRGDATILPHGTPTNRRATRDKHQAPTLLLVHPLSLQDGGRHSHSSPHSVINIHQGACSNRQGLFFVLNLALIRKEKG